MMETAGKQFWKYFAQNAQKLFCLDKQQDEVLTNLLKEIKKVHPDLTFEIGSKVGDTKEFIISADGIKDTFSVVLFLIEIAPKLRGWQIIAFKPRKAPDTAIAIAGITISIEDVLFEYFLEEKDKIGILMYIKDFKKSDIHYQVAIFPLLDALLGEFDVETKIGSINIQPLLPNMRRKKLRPLRELPSVVDTYFQKRAD